MRISGFLDIASRKEHSIFRYNFQHRFTEETAEGRFRWILEEAAKAGYLSPKAVCVDSANANTKKQVKVQIPAASRR